MSTANTLELRVSEARARVIAAAAEVDRRGNSVTANARWEEAASDLAHYVQLRDALEGDASHVYRDGGPVSFFADAVNATRSDKAAYARLAEVRGMAAYGGLVVPKFLGDRIASSGHSLKPVADYLGETLPNTGVTVTVSRVSTPSTAAVQPVEGDPIAPSNPASTELAIPITTVAATATMTMQLVERSDTAALDRMYAVEILGGCDAELERNLVNGSGSAGEATGLLNTVSAGSYTMVATTADGQLDAIARTSAAVQEAVGASPDTLILAPRRWRWLLANSTKPQCFTVDTSTSPVAGTILGLNAITTAAMPLTLGTSTDEDRIIICRSQDVYAGLAPVTLEVRTQAANLAQNVTALAVVKRYYAVGAIRPASVMILSGTGLKNCYT
jgi:hypothetical protein